MDYLFFFFQFYRLIVVQIEAAEAQAKESTKPKGVGQNTTQENKGGNKAKGGGRKRGDGRSCSNSRKEERVSMKRSGRRRNLRGDIEKDRSGGGKRGSYYFLDGKDYKLKYKTSRLLSLNDKTIVCNSMMDLYVTCKQLNMK